MSTTRNLRLVPRCFVTSPSRCATWPAACTVAACTRYFAAAWRGQPKWVVSRSLKSVGPNATLVGNDVEGVIRRLKAELDGEIDVAGPDLARSLTDLGLIDQYRIYLHPVVLGCGKSFFAGPRPSLRLKASERMDEDV